MIILCVCVISPSLGLEHLAYLNKFERKRSQIYPVLADIMKTDSPAE